MTDELQTDESENDLDIDPIENEEAESGTGETGAELAPAPEGEQEKSADDGVQKAINRQHAKYREEERKRIAAEEQASKLKERLDAIEAEKGEVTIPPMPDPYEDDFEEKAKARDEAIRRKASQDAQQQYAVEQQNASAEAAQKAEQERIQSLVNDYDGRIVKLGLDRVDVRNAGDKVIEYGISAELAEHIMEMEDGPLVTKYLADNPIIVDELRHMSPIKAALKINSDVKPAASALKPQASSAPDPTETLSGRGASEQVSKFIQGATFE